MHRIGMVGLGHWGPYLARSFELTGRAELAWLCDQDGARIDQLLSRYRGAQHTAYIDDVLADDSVTAVALATPAGSHYELARRCLEAGKHVLVEKPLTTDSDSGRKLLELADKTGRILMVGHVFEYNATVLALRDLVLSGELGEVYYLNFERTNLGPVRTDVDALWDLGTHDIGIMAFLLGQYPVEVSARGLQALHRGNADTVFATLGFETGPVAHLHVSWLNPRKVRQITVIGSKKMAVWDDMDMRTPIRVFDKRVEAPDRQASGDSFMSFKTLVVDGGIFAPNIGMNHPLEEECNHFLDCVENGSAPRSDARHGLKVVSVLEAATKSMQNEGLTAPVIYDSTLSLVSSGAS